MVGYLNICTSNFLEMRLSLDFEVTVTLIITINVIHIVLLGPISVLVHFLNVCNNRPVSMDFSRSTSVDLFE